MSVERRHGPGQRLTNNTFRQFLTTVVAKHGDIALQGMENFCKVPARRAVRSPLASSHMAASVAGMGSLSVHVLQC
jgi:hypothetical protein